MVNIEFAAFMQDIDDIKTSKDSNNGDLHFQ
jgi:hypothetical protein